MDKAVIYIHGKGGSAEEAVHYRTLFPDSDVIGFDYKAQTPWQAKTEFQEYFDSVSCGYRSVTIVANSIGAYFAMSALAEKPVSNAFFISPVVDMERLIRSMMKWANVSEEELRQKGKIETDFDETLSWEYLSYASAHPICWKSPAHILFGEQDSLTSYETMAAFSEHIGADLTVMKDGEHWFHTEEQMKFLDNWILTYKDK